jgi:predicted dehydrogenase
MPPLFIGVNMKKVINWAVVGTGGITNKFITGLFAAEGAKPLAVVSRNKASAESFADKYGVLKKYDSYDDMLGDSSVDVIYIGTPHSTHKELAIKAFRAKKSVLCEKPLCINAAELREMINSARENKVFFMEAMWTRYVPPVRKVREWLAQDLIGEVKFVQANFGFNFQPRNPESRLLKAELGGGALLDAGVYPVSMASMVYGGRKPEHIGSVLQTGDTNVDEITSAVISYGKSKAASLSTSLCVSLQNDAWIYGSQGYIHIPNFVFAHSAEYIFYGRETYRFEGDFISNGYNYQAEEVMDCLREGRLESSVMTLDESLTIMETMDAIRRQWNFKYPME